MASPTGKRKREDNDDDDDDEKELAQAAVMAPPSSKKSKLKEAKLQARGLQDKKKREAAKVKRHSLEQAQEQPSSPFTVATGTVQPETTTKSTKTPPRKPIVSSSTTTSKKASTVPRASATGTGTTTTKATTAMTASPPNVPMRKSDDSSVASTLANDEITAKQLCKDVEQIIESWVKDLHGDQPTEAQEEALKQSICILDNRVQQEGIDQPNSAVGNTENKTDDEGPMDNIPDTCKPTTLLELAYYILQSFDDKKLEELKLRVGVVKSASIYFESRDEFEEALKEVPKDRIEAIVIAQINYEQNSLNKAMDHINALLCPPNKLVEKINSRSKSLPPSTGTILAWRKDFVKALEPICISFPGDSSKGSAVVVSGESGSGKTWFARYYIPDVLGADNLAMVYYSVQDNDGHLEIIADDSIKKHSMACQKCMNYLVKDRGEGRVYQCVSKLSMKYNKDRDEKAYKWLNDRIETIMKPDDDAKKWWNSDRNTKYDPVDKLVLVVDEVGKNPELARGLVSKVRDIYEDITRWKARNVLLVLVGSGMDFYISQVISDQDTRTTITSFGTDPLKSSIIRLKGPDLSQDKIYGIETSSIMNGTYSRVLATNTRMLTRGVLPIMKIPELTDEMPEDKKPARYEALGSTNIAMDYAARKYVALNGLARLKITTEQLNGFILTQFKLLLRQGVYSIQASNPAAAKLLTVLKTQDSDFHSTLALGLITSDIKSTSPALRYLACGGNSAPLDAQDGIGFEIVVQHHLVRLGELYNNDIASRWVGTCNLSEAWPPASGITGAEIRRLGGAKKRVDAFSNLKAYDTSISDIAKIVINKENFYLVMRQKVSNAQGPDIMLLRKSDGKVLLDLFQCKPWKNIPGVESKKFNKAFWSLGVKFDEGTGKNIKIDPDCGSAGYSYLGIKEFADKLGAKLNTKVEIGDRILVFSKSFKEWKCQKTDFLQYAFENGVMVWTGEMLEPTISALYYAPTTE